MNRGVPPTALNARTGEFTPPGMRRCARAKSSSDCVMDRYCNGGRSILPSAPGRPPVSSPAMTVSRRVGLVLSGLAVVVAGLVAARVALDAKVVIDRDAEWREACLGCRRAGGTGDALAVARLALVHLHGLSGRPGSLELLLSAPGTPVPLAVARGADEPPLLETRLGEAPQPVRVPLASGQRDVDVWLRATSEHGLPMLLHRIVLTRDSRVIDRLLQLLPLAAGLAVLGLLSRRQPLGVALVFALATLAAVTLAVQVLHDPAALLETKAGPRERAQIALVALLAVAALWSPPGRRLALAAIALAGGLLYLPTAGHGL